MKKEIGSIFPLSDLVLSQAEAAQAQFPSDRIYYSLCREALCDIAKALNGTTKKVLIPAYTCQTVITPFEECGWQCVYFPIKRDLRIDTHGLVRLVEDANPSLVVVHPYFGMDLNDEEVATLVSVKERGIDIVLDLTQCLFSTKRYSFVTFIVASYRKWMPIPDGGYLINISNRESIRQPENENTEFTEREKAAMYLRGQYFGNGERRTKDISIRLSKAADHIAESNIKPHKMSQIAYNLLQIEGKEHNQQRRFDNYSYLFHNLYESSKVAKVCHDLKEVTTFPLYFTIYVENRRELQRLLAQDAVYAPVIWPVEDDCVLINDEVKYIYEHILAIPCDQRYDENDMQRVVDILNRF
jgi:dTDP-4-amino-4,6-dideoxygalactose transaminase